LEVFLWATYQEIAVDAAVTTTAETTVDAERAFSAAEATAVVGFGLSFCCLASVETETAAMGFSAAVATMAADAVAMTVVCGSSFCSSSAVDGAMAVTTTAETTVDALTTADATTTVDARHVRAVTLWQPYFLQKSVRETA